MKKQYKLLAVFVAVVLVVCCCCIPVSAAEMTTGVCALIGNDFTEDNSKFGVQLFIQNFAVSSDKIQPINVTGSTKKQNGDYDYWYANYQWNAGGKDPGSIIVEYPLSYSGQISLHAGDIIKLSVDCTFNGGDKPLDIYGLSLYDTAGNLITRKQYSMSSGEPSYKLSRVITLEKLVDTACTVGRLEMYFSRAENNWSINSWGFGMTGDIEIVYGNPDDIVIQSQLSDLDKKTEQMIAEQEETNKKMDAMITEQEETNKHLGEITGDKYDAPESGAVDDIGNVEGEIEQSTQEGFNALTDTFKAFSLDTFTDGLGGIATIYNRIIPKCPWLFNLINISLGLGLFAFLLGLAQAYIGRLNANDRQARTEKYRRGRRGK